MSKTKVEIIYQDDDIIVINKPAGVSVTKDRSGQAQLTDILPPAVCAQLRLVHRLDKDTSGVMLLAKNVEAQTKFTAYFEKREVKKTYLAIVTGFVPDQQGTIDAPLTRDPKNTALMCIAKKKGKAAVTNWQLLADFGSTALLAVHPLTGRTHQIRVHLPSIALPLAIDPLYGSSRPIFLSEFKSEYRLGKFQVERPLIERLTLHAYQLVIPALTENRPSCFVAGLDKKFAACLKMLTKYNPKGLNAFIDPGDFSNILEGKML
jgi:23S rRNA pseudouridine1911/1915/1917 synthase